MDLFAVAPLNLNADRLLLKNLVLYESELKALLVLSFSLASLFYFSLLLGALQMQYQSCISRANFGKASVRGAGRKLGLTLSDGQSLSAPSACDRYSEGQLNILKTKRSMLKIALTGQAQELFANGKLFAKPDGGISATKPVRSRNNDVAAEKGNHDRERSLQQVPLQGQCQSAGTADDTAAEATCWCECRRP